MTLPLPRGATPILQARMNGVAPAGMVIVSMVGSVWTAHPLIQVKPDEVYDWRVLHGLDVCVYLPDGNDWAMTVKAIALARPAHLNVWNPKGKWGAHVYLVPTAEDAMKPVPLWTYELIFQEWMAFQNNDFLVGRTYARGSGGVPYAVDP
jgi:hypothetical protein